MPDATVSISEATEVTPELIEAFARLIPHLSRSAPPPDATALAEIVSSPSSVLLIARDADGRIVGSMTLVLFRIPTGKRAWIEDVVVDASVENQGIGSALNREALRRAAEADVRTVDLTSRPDREAANHLYAKLGFQRRETNIYRHDLG